MHENCTAASPDAWNVIIPYDHHEIIECIVAPERLGTGAIGTFNFPVVVPIARRIAPAGLRTNRPAWKLGFRPASSIGPIEHAAKCPSATGRSAVALTLPSNAAGSTKRARPAAPREAHDAPCRCGIERSHDKTLRPARFPGRHREHAWRWHFLTRTGTYIRRVTIGKTISTLRWVIDFCMTYQGRVPS